VAHRSPPLQGGGVWIHGTHDGAGTLPIREAGSGATIHVATPEPTSIGRQGSVLQDMWVHIPLLILDLKLICRGTRSTGYRQWPRAHLGRGCEPAGGDNSSVPRLVILNFLLGNYLFEPLAA
jgi:hypothetical protein